MNPATKGIQYDPSYDTKGTTMTTNINLPEGFKDWVESEYPGSDSDRLRVMVDHFPGDGYGTQKQTLWFTPPKPKPTLPDVKPGAVVRYVDLIDRQCRAIKLDGMCRTPWRVFTNRKTGVDSIDLTDEELLDDVNADGFTVELDGL